MTIAKAWRRLVRYISFAWIPNSAKTVVQSRINGYSILVLANEDVGRNIHFCRSYEDNESRYLRNFISKQSICLDVGANVGYFTLLMGKVATEGRVYAFEPIALNASLLRASVELNGFENIEVVEYAVGAANGNATLSQSTDSAYSSFLDTERKPVEKHLQVPMITLDAFILERKIRSIDVIKVDVEGAEGLVIAGAQSLFADATTRPKLVLIELFDANLKPFNTDARTIIQTLNDFGYTPHVVNDDGQLVTFREEFLKSVYNVVFLDTEHLNHG